MVSFGPDVQGLNYIHKYSFVDLRNKNENSPSETSFSSSFAGTAKDVCSSPNTIFNYIKTKPEFSKFRKIVARAQMDGFLDNIEANFTILIPEDRYLSHIPKEFFDTMDNGLARQILSASSIDRRIDKKLITSSPVAYYFTKNPKMRMYITNIDSKTQVNNCMEIIKYDIKLDNGLIHITNGLIVPSEDHFMN